MGSYVTRLLLKRGWFVYGIDKCTYAANVDLLDEFFEYENFSFDKQDINEIEFLYDCDYIINTAAETHVTNSIADSSAFVKSNVDGVYHLLELIRGFRSSERKPKLIHFSTDEVYGDIEVGSFLESDTLKPSNPYSATKAAADMLILAWARTYGINYVIVRPTNNYGVNQYVEKLVPKSIKYLSIGRKIPLHNKGTPVRTWLHAADTARAILTILESGACNEVFNISGNYEDSNLNVVTKIINTFDSTYCTEDHINLDFERAGQDVRYSIDDSKLRSLGWENKRDFDKEILEIVAHYSLQRRKIIW
jgi:dTDP-glucose 4,6-dehydratase